MLAEPPATITSPDLGCFAFASAAVYIASIGPTVSVSA